MRWGQVLADRRLWVRDAVFTAGAALTIALMGPYGSYDEPVEVRVVRSLAFGFAGMVLLWPPMRLALAAGERARLPLMFVMVIGLCLLSIPVTLATFWIARLLGDAGPAGALQRYFAVLTMVLPVGVGYLLVDRWLARPQAAGDVAPPRTPALLERLPVALRGELLALQAEDHYVRVHTRAGSTLLLMRLADAIAEAAPIEGARVHRSWWVARPAIRASRTEGRRMTLTLVNGLEVPVTREAGPRLRKLRWV